MGWWILIGVLAIVVIMFTFRERRRHRENMYRDIIHSLRVRAGESERRADILADVAAQRYARGVATGLTCAALEIEHMLLNGPKVIYVDDPPKQSDAEFNCIDERVDVLGSER
jgi:hypothetical protein